ncbi:hypothetical protein JCM19275_3416 [Nonlabens ulvanivorans]|uniref:Uncharacterized protein n=1 Tax=Nonlabens ulvanivorans TaxID=906888 RepID=A0A090WC82_NONUL|nr:hypothetical protein JCM19275_3416 [Nonlabens ulvanivorans]
MRNVLDLCVISTIFLCFIFFPLKISFSKMFFSENRHFRLYSIYNIFCRFINLRPMWRRDKYK